MPSLQDTLRKDGPSGYAPMPASPQEVAPLPAPVSLPGQDNTFKVNPWIRTPLPPINAGPDTLRQFNDGNTNVPHRRVLPLPATTGLGGSVVNTTNVTVTGASSSGTTTGIAAQSISITTPLLGSRNTVYLAPNVKSKSFQLVSCVANGACEVRIYGSASAMSIDAARAIDAPLPAELANGLVSDIVLDTSPFKWNWQNRVGVNDDSPQTTVAYIAITNLSSFTTQIQVTITAIPLESA